MLQRLFVSDLNFKLVIIFLTSVAITEKRLHQKIHFHELFKTFTESYCHYKDLVY
jgi:hypothetical protein